MYKNAYEKLYTAAGIPAQLDKQAGVIPAKAMVLGKKLLSALKQTASSAKQKTVSGAKAVDNSWKNTFGHPGVPKTPEQIMASAGARVLGYGIPAAAAGTAIASTLKAQEDAKQSRVAVDALKERFRTKREAEDAVKRDALNKELLSQVAGGVVGAGVGGAGTYGISKLLDVSPLTRTLLTMAGTATGGTLGAVYGPDIINAFTKEPSKKA